MAICENIKITKSRICTGDMDQKITLQNRTIVAPDFGELNPTTTYTTILEPYAAVATISLMGGAVRRFDGVNINDTPTHQIYIFYDATIWPLDSDNTFILLEDGRRLRIVGVDDMNEMHETIRLLCTERGIDTQAGTEA